MIAHKEHTSVSFFENEDNITTWSFELSDRNSTSLLSETSAHLQESVEDLRQQIATLQSTIVDLQNAVAATMPVRSHDATWTQQLQNSFLYKSLFGGNHAASHWNILEWYDLILLSSVVLVLLSTLCAEYGGYIEPRDDIKIGYAIGILFFGGLIVRASSLYKYTCQRVRAIRH